jgi:carboxylesterase
MKVYKSIKGHRRSRSCSFNFKDLKNSDASDIDEEMINSTLHVLTRIEGR